MDIFYHAMNYNSKGIVDAAFEGVFRRKSVKEATQLIEELAKRNYRAPSGASGSSIRLSRGGVLELNKMPVIKAKLDALMSKMNNQEKQGTLAMKWEFQSVLCIN